MERFKAGLSVVNSIVALYTIFALLSKLTFWDASWWTVLAPFGLLFGSEAVAGVALGLLGSLFFAMGRLVETDEERKHRELVENLERMGKGL